MGRAHTTVLFAAGVLAFVGSLVHAQRAIPFSHRVDVLTASRALPPALAARVSQPIGFVRAASGPYLILDRHAHTLFRLDAGWTSVQKLAAVGIEQGSIIEPGALAVNSGDVVAVSDAPGGRERIQLFTLNGDVLGGFYLAPATAPRLVAERLIINGAGSVQFNGTSLLINRPEAGTLIQELDLQGRVVRHFGELRETGHESDAILHSALNSGLPLVDPTGGFFLVFQSGVPAFRKYDASGTLLYERHIEGVEVDEAIQALPRTWQPRAGSDLIPVVEPIVRAAAVDSRGQLWVALSAPFTYVYDAAGDKIRTVQFRGPALISPTTLSFAKDDRVLVTPGCYEFVTR